MSDEYSGRWLTGALNRNILADLTALENVTFDAILKFARDPANCNCELLHCLDGGGKRVIEESTGRREAVITAGMWSAAKAEPVRFWHNHPSQDSLSHLDWRVASAFPSIEVVAINESGSIFIGRMPEWRDEYEDLFLNRCVLISGHVEFAMEKLAKKAEMRIDDINHFAHRTGHILNLALAQCEVVKYAYQLSQSDEENFQIARAFGVVDVGLDYARKLINEQLG